MGPCRHGANPRQCYTCELEEQIVELESRLHKKEQGPTKGEIMANRDDVIDLMNKLEATRAALHELLDVLGALEKPWELEGWSISQERCKEMQKLARNE